MDQGRCDRSSCNVHREGGNHHAPCEHTARRFPLFTPRPKSKRTLTARSGASHPRVRRLLAPSRPKVNVRLAGHHDFGDGRHAIEFEAPAMDMMLYHDRGVTIAEWVTTEGLLIALVPVGEC